MAFFKRIMDHLINQLLVDSLANRCAMVPHVHKEWERGNLRAASRAPRMRVHVLLDA